MDRQSDQSAVFILSGDPDPLCIASSQHRRMGSTARRCFMKQEPCSTPYRKAGTMDAIAGLAFGIVVVNVIRQMGVTDDTAVAGEVLHSGILAGILMAFIYILTILMGAQSLGLFAVSENGGIALSQPPATTLAEPVL